MKAKHLIIITFLWGLCCYSFGQSTHPRILVQPSDRQAILLKIDQQAWCKEIYDGMISRLQPYVDRHQSDPEWILSRYLMNWAPGKRYTKFISDSDGTQLIGWEVDAPVPTVRVSTHKRDPMSSTGGSFRSPSIEDLLPYDTAFMMRLQTSNDEWEWTDPQYMISSINGRINQLALDAAILYWLTGTEKYAVFAADILNQWARGAVHQEPVEGPWRVGFLDIQTLGDRNYESLILAYDFLYDFLKSKSYEMSYYGIVFNKMAHTMTFRGYWSNNWYAVQTTPLVYAALSLEDKSQCDDYLQYVLKRDTINGSWGRYGLASTVKNLLSHDGHWEEPGGYHTFPLTHLITASLALENNGYNVFGQFPALFDASYVMLKYAFPNFQGSSFGDTGRPSQSPSLLEMGIKMAEKYNPEKMKSLLSAMDVLIKDGYRRERSGYMGLLCYTPTIPSGNKDTYAWPRSGALDFARCYLQRNGMDATHGLMYVVQGATYNHNHANGMAMELYGKGYVMGIDPGNGLNYEDPMHVGYYAQWGAHNTVVSAARSTSVPYVRGGGGTKNMGQVELEAMEPLADQEAVSPLCSFTDTRYVDISTGTNQQRTMAIIRTSDTTGYYLDVYRSDNQESNQYLYHNIGNSIGLTDMQNKPLILSACDYPVSKQPTTPSDPPGFRFMKEYQTSGERKESTRAVFAMENFETKTYMQVLMPGETGREYMTAQAPLARTAPRQYSRTLTPTLICQQQGEAWTRPFITIYEPYCGEDNASVTLVESVRQQAPGEFTLVKVTNRSGTQQNIFQSTNRMQVYKTAEGVFKGAFAVVSLKGKQVEYLYLGVGQELSFGGYSLKTASPEGAANLETVPDGYVISCNQPTDIVIPDVKIKKIIHKNSNEEKEIKFVTAKTGISFSVPAGKDIQLSILR